MIRGRRPTPTSLKVLNGNPGKRPLNGREPRPKSKIPPCPSYLGDVAKAEWRRLVRELDGTGLLSGLDRDVLAAYCQAYSLWVEAVEAIQRYGTMVKSPNGFPMQSPYLAVLNKQAEIMHRLGSELGLSPSARTRLHVPEADVGELLEAFQAEIARRA